MFTVPRHEEVILYKQLPKLNKLISLAIKEIVSKTTEYILIIITYKQRLIRNTSQLTFEIQNLILSLF